EEASAVGAPHRPDVPRPAWSELPVLAVVEKYQFRLVDVRVAVAPPLSVARAASCKRQPFVVGRRRGEVLVRVALIRYRDRRSARDAHPEDVAHPGDVLAVRREVEPFPIARPGVELIESAVVRNARQRASGEIEDVDVP